MSGIFDHTIVKPCVAGVVAMLGDRFIMNNQNWKSAGMFDVAVASGVFVAGMIGDTVAPYFPTSTPIGAFSKNLEGRIVEVTCGAAGAYALNRFVLKNELSQRDMVFKLGIIVGADITGEIIAEMIELAART